MVVEYRSAGEGSFTSCCTVVPCVLGQCYGSVIPHVLPQVLLVVGFAALSRWWNPLREIEPWGGGSAGGNDQEEPDLAQAMNVVGVLLAFLMVFKTQSAYGQFWEVCLNPGKPCFRNVFQLMDPCLHTCPLDAISPGGQPDRTSTHGVALHTAQCRAALLFCLYMTHRRTVALSLDLLSVTAAAAARVLRSLATLRG